MRLLSECFHFLLELLLWFVLSAMTNMTPQQKYQKIRESCIKANPALLELTLGCETKRKNKLYFYVDENKVSRIGTILYTLYCPPDREFITVIGSEIEKYKILGHEPQLSDVLLAIGKVDENYFIDSRGGFGELFIESESFLFQAIPEYNLLKPSLRSQSPETIDFIYNLICKE